MIRWLPLGPEQDTEPRHPAKSPDVTGLLRETDVPSCHRDSGRVQLAMGAERPLRPESRWGSTA